MSKKNKLFDDDSDEEVTIKTENQYAKKYDTWREKEELHKLEQKYGSKGLKSDVSDSESSEDESDEPLEVTEEVEKQFLKTLSLLKTKDPRIYDPSFKFFEEKHEKEKETKNELKKVTFADSDDDEDDDPNIFSIEKKAEISDDEEKEGKNDEKDGKLRNYLIGKVNHVDEDIEKDLAPLRALWSDPKLNDGEAFLRDYILNKRYLEDGDKGEAEEKLRDDEDLEEDEKRVEEQGKFERAYNFRFEEPDEEYLKRFPRTMNYIRPKDDKRSRKRAEQRSRKEEEKTRKMEEIARLKALKLKEIQEKIAKLKEVSGNQELGLREEDIESDFDPDEHDKRMKAIFDEQYYGDVDQHKPEFPELDEELEIENWDKYAENVNDGTADEDPHCEDDDFNMDADYDPKKTKQDLLEELKQSMGKKRRNRKRKSKLAELLSNEKPKFVPDVNKTYSEYMEEYYKMDCEDVIAGDLPTRFKYRQVEPNDYGLTVEEILLADDKELTQWVPLKKLLKFRHPNLEKGDVNVYLQKAADKNLKKKILPSLFKDLPEEPEVVVPAEQIEKKKRKKKKVSTSETISIESEQNRVRDVANSESVEKDDNTVEVAKDKRKKKKKNKMVKNIDTHENNDIIMENGSSHKEDNNKNKRKKIKNQFIVENIANIEPSHSEVNLEQSKHNENDCNSQKKRKIEDIQETHVPNKKHKNNKNVQNVDIAEHKNVTGKRNNKNKFKQKNKIVKNKRDSGDPMSQLSDERLKAYGLNPKKYRSFLKYKKF